jgi:hypothetical protein
LLSSFAIWSSKNARELTPTFFSIVKITFVFHRYRLDCFQISMVCDKLKVWNTTTHVVIILAQCNFEWTPPPCLLSRYSFIHVYTLHDLRLFMSLLSMSWSRFLLSLLSFSLRLCQWQQ